MVLGLVSLDLATDTWRTLPALESGVGDYPLESVTGRSTAWTDEGLFVWGGRTSPAPTVPRYPQSADPLSTTVADGAIWTPSGD